MFLVIRHPSKQRPIAQLLGKRRHVLVRFRHRRNLPFLQANLPSKAVSVVGNAALQQRRRVQFARQKVMDKPRDGLPCATFGLRQGPHQGHPSPGNQPLPGGCFHRPNIPRRQTFTPPARLREGGRGGGYLRGVFQKAFIPIARLREGGRGGGYLTNTHTLVRGVIRVINNPRPILFLYRFRQAI